MKIDPATQESLYRTLSGAVVPRPIGWIATTSTDGIDNLAPYSFSNVVGVDPPLVMFAPVDKGPDALKDSARNVLDTGEFVYNVVTADLAEKMNATSATLPPAESEFDTFEIERAASNRITPPRVAAADIAFECDLYETVDLGGSTLILGEVVLVHVDEEVTTDGKVDVAKLDAIGRLAGDWYTTTTDRFSMDRPP